jgi:hypothetical protein
MICYALPTRDRPEELRRTLDAIAALGDHRAVGGARVIVADNDSRRPVDVPESLASGVPVHVLRRDRNESAAARNACVAATGPEVEWIVMLDDDSHPLDAGHLLALREAPRDVAAVQAEIFLPDGSHERGGLPEVFIGCGVAIRREAYLALGGYDARFDYYAEEYDLAARMIAGGWRVTMDRRFRVEHRKVASNRRFGRVVRRLVRNNAWVQQRYAPESQRAAELRETLSRYARIALKERALLGYARGLLDLAMTLRRQPRSPLPEPLYDRFTGLAAARAALHAAHAARPLGRVALVAEGKNAWAVRAALAELGLSASAHPDEADTLVIGTLSPGPMLDALAELQHANPGRRVVTPWELPPAGAPAKSRPALTLAA